LDLAGKTPGFLLWILDPAEAREQSEEAPQVEALLDHFRPIRPPSSGLPEALIRPGGMKMGVSPTQHR